MVSPQTAAAWHVPGSPGTTGEDEGNTGCCSGPGKCLSLCCGFVTVAWKNFSGVFFLLGRRAGGEVLLAGKPTWQGWASLGHRVKQDAPCHPLPLLCFWLRLGTKLRGEAQQQEMGRSALLVYFITESLMKNKEWSLGLGPLLPMSPGAGWELKLRSCPSQELGTQERMCECREGAKCQAQECLPE